jgi:outer membrane protein OmpA-like peptidoglycan-associated protein/tetratricopeptide (TPR) repeat protein
MLAIKPSTSVFSLTFLILMLVNPFMALAQPGQLSTKNKKAINLFQEGRMQFEYRKNEEAYELLSKAVEQDDNFYEAHMLLADVCNDLKKNEESITHYKKAISLAPLRFPPVYYNLAGVEMDMNLYSDAVQHMQQFLGIKTISKDLRTKGEQRFASAVFAEKAFANPVPFIPVNLGEAINSIHNDYHPSLTVDEDLLIFTRMRPADGLTDNGGSMVEEDFYISRRKNGEWLPAIPLGEPINTHGNEGAHSISPDGRYFYFTGCERPEGFGSCDLYVSEKAGDKWSKPKNLGELINSSTWDAQPTIGPDGKTLVFTSKRKGGYGMADLWMSRKRDNGTWTMPTNLGDSINTPFDEFGPFLHPDGKTLYFSSSGHPGMGGKDIFYSRLKADGTWSTPVNLGYPINTKDEEFHMIVSADGKKGYFSSDREGGIGKRDLYMFDLYEAARPQAVTFMRGKVREEVSFKPIAANIEVIDLETGELKASTKSDAINGEFLISLPSGSSYAVNADAKGFLFYSGNYTLGKELTQKDEYKVDILLSPVKAGSKVVLNNIFFEFGEAKLKSQSKVELNKLVQFLESNPDVRIEIGGHTDDVGNDEFNQKLSEQRATSVVNYLTENKIEAARLEAKGYGEKSPLATNATETGRAINRRTEFKILPSK